MPTFDVWQTVPLQRLNFHSACLHLFPPANLVRSAATAQGGNAAALASATATALAQAGNQCCDQAAQVGGYRHVLLVCGVGRVDPC